jgi:hypothetical protein
MGFIIGGTYTPPLASIMGVYGTSSMAQPHINVDSSNNIYINAMQSGGNNRIIKINSSGTTQWQAGKQDDMAGTLNTSQLLFCIKCIWCRC